MSLRSGKLPFLAAKMSLFTIRVLAVLGEIRGGGPVWDVKSGGTVGVLVADCPRLQSRARLKPETMIVTFQGFSPTHDFFDYTGSIHRTIDDSILIYRFTS